MSIDEELSLLSRMKEIGRWMVLSTIGAFTGCLSFVVAYLLAPPHAFDNGFIPPGMIFGLISIVSSIVGLGVNISIKNHLSRKLTQT
jgi:hypothetical protein